MSGKMKKKVSSAISSVTEIFSRIIKGEHKSDKPYPELQSLKFFFNSNKSSPKILMFGDSVVERVSKDDSDTRHLGQMVCDELNSWTPARCIAHSAYNPQVYYYLTSALRLMKRKPSLLILPVNMRCFSPQWDLNPGWQFEEEIQVIKEYIANPNNKIKPVRWAGAKERISAESMQVFNATQISYPCSSFTEIGQFVHLIESKPETEEEQLFRKQQIFVFHYMHRLVKEQRKLSYLEKILDLLSEMDIFPFIYLTPINYIAGEKYVGSEFSQIVRANVRLLQDTLLSHQKEDRIQFFDWSMAFSSEYFFYSDITTEHINQEGRLKLARMVASEIHQKYSN
jgi:hypothetical protein